MPEQRVIYKLLLLLAATVLKHIFKYSVTEGPATTAECYRTSPSPPPRQTRTSSQLLHLFFGFATADSSLQNAGGADLVFHDQPHTNCSVLRYRSNDIPFGSSRCIGLTLLQSFRNKVNCVGHQLPKGRQNTELKFARTGCRWKCRVSENWAHYHH